MNTNTNTNTNMNANEVLQALQALQVLAKSLQSSANTANANTTDTVDSATDTDANTVASIPADNITINRVIGSGANKPNAPRRKARPFVAGQELVISDTVKVTVVENRPRRKVNVIMAWDASDVWEVKLFPEGLLMALTGSSQAPTATKATQLPANTPAKTPAPKASAKSQKGKLTEADKDDMALAAIQSYCATQHITPDATARHASQNTCYVWHGGLRIHLNPKTGHVKSTYPAGNTLASWRNQSKYRFF